MAFECTHCGTYTHMSTRCRGHGPRCRPSWECCLGTATRWRGGGVAAHTGVPTENLYAYGCVKHAHKVYVCARSCELQALPCCREYGRTMAMLDECHEQLNCLRTAARAQAATCIVLHTIIRAADLAHPPAVVDQLYRDSQARASISTRCPCHILFAAGLERQATIMALLWPGHFASAT